MSPCHCPNQDTRMLQKKRITLLSVTKNDVGDIAQIDSLYHGDIKTISVTISFLCHPVIALIKTHVCDKKNVLHY